MCHNTCSTSCRCRGSGKRHGCEQRNFKTVVGTCLRGCQHGVIRGVCRGTHPRATHCHGNVTCNGAYSGNRQGLGRVTIRGHGSGQQRGGHRPVTMFTGQLRGCTTRYRLLCRDQRGDNLCSVQRCGKHHYRLCTILHRNGFCTRRILGSASRGTQHVTTNCTHRGSQGGGRRGRKYIFNYSRQRGHKRDILKFWV